MRWDECGNKPGLGKGERIKKRKNTRGPEGVWKKPGWVKMVLSISLKKKLPGVVKEAGKGKRKKKFV